MKADDYIKWHPAFFQVIRLELADYQDTLRFLPEYQLTTEPLRIDVLIERFKTKYIEIFQKHRKGTLAEKPLIE